ncbi:MAG TPA: hypothetical protein VF475_17610 [Sphingobium sp.]
MSGSGGMGESAARHHRHIFIGCALALLLMTIYLLRIDSDDIVVRYFREQDLPVLTGLFGSWLVIVLVPWTPNLPVRSLFDRDIAWVALLAVMGVLLWWGTYAVMFDYSLTRDEHMVLFDMAVFGKGHLAEPLAPEWRGFAKALVPAFLLQPSHPIGVVSDYLPGNAWLRLTVSRITDPALMNPMLAVMGGLALLNVAKRLFGEDRGAIAIAMLLYVSSAQMLVNAMTVYAMTPHMALNLIWLAAFLRGGKAGHGIAMLVGSYAMGLHQIIFHPLFAGPFLLWSFARREWRVVAFYACGYAVAAFAWTHYAGLASLSAAPPELLSGGANADFLRDRLMPLLLNRNPNMLLLMGYNVGRFLAWQNLALLPLAVAAWAAVRRNEGLAAPLMAGPVLALVVVGFLLPYQGHGWGYRYLHGFLGSFALLGGYGWQVLRKFNGGKTPFSVIVLACLTLISSLPWLLIQAHWFVAPYVRLDHVIQGAATDMVLVDTQAPSAAVDQVRNRPDLGNRPIRLSSRELTSSDVLTLCQRGTISLLTRKDMHNVGFALGVPTNSPKFDALVAPLAHASCLRDKKGDGWTRTLWLPQSAGL